MVSKPTLKYRQVEEFLRQQISSQILRAGDQLPSHGELRAHFGCTQATIERAHALLESDGLIERRHRLGIFVTGASDQRSKGISAGDTIAVASLYGHHQPLPGVSGWEASVAHGALTMAQNEDFLALLVHPSRLVPEEIGRLKLHPLAGIVLCLSSLEPDLVQRIQLGLEDLNLNVVTYGDMSQFGRYDSVTSDHRAGARKLTEHLISKGRRRILNLAFDYPHIDCYWQHDRQLGYEDAMHAAGLEPSPALVMPFRQEASIGWPELDFEREVGWRVADMKEFFLGPEPCDGLLVESDGLVYQVGLACRRLGLEPGQDILLGGYDNYANTPEFFGGESTMLSATIDKHNFALGAAALELLVARNRGELPDEPQHRSIEPELILLGAPQNPTRRNPGEELAGPAGINGNLIKVRH